MMVWGVYSGEGTAKMTWGFYSGEGTGLMAWGVYSGEGTYRPDGLECLQW